jgi:hypothetical protein
MAARLWAAPVLVAVFLSGCGEPQPEWPELHAVSGVVKQNGKPVTGGAVQFAPRPERWEFHTNSEVGPDGRFTLTTVRTTDAQGERRPGAPAGEYQVTYIAPIADQTAGFTEPKTLTRLVTIAAGANDLNIELNEAAR